MEVSKLKLREADVNKEAVDADVKEALKLKLMLTSRRV